MLNSKVVQATRNCHDQIWEAVLVFRNPSFTMRERFTPPLACSTRTRTRESFWLWRFSSAVSSPLDGFLLLSENKWDNSTRGKEGENLDRKPLTTHFERWGTVFRVAPPQVGWVWLVSELFFFLLSSWTGVSHLWSVCPGAPYPATAASGPGRRRKVKSPSHVQALSVNPRQYEGVVRVLSRKAAPARMLSLPAAESHWATRRLSVIAPTRCEPVCLYGRARLGRTLGAGYCHFWREIILGRRWRGRGEVLERPARNIEWWITSKAAMGSRYFGGRLTPPSRRSSHRPTGKANTSWTDNTWSERPAAMAGVRRVYWRGVCCPRRGWAIGSRWRSEACGRQKW